MEVKIGNRIAEVELISKEGNNVKISIDGKIYDCDTAIVQNGYCSILHDGRSFNAELIRSEDGRNYKVTTHYSTYNVEIIDATAKYLSMKKNSGDKQENKIVTPMAGQVVSIPVKEGDQLKAGDTAIVVEAMKMQSNYKVVADCTIKKILVKEGDAVDTGETLILLDLNS